MTNQLAIELDRPGIGHNQPPLDQQLTAEIAPHIPRVDDLAAVSATAAIIDEESERKVADLFRMIAELEVELDTAREARKKPFLEAGRLVDATFNPQIARLKLIRLGPDGRTGGLRGMLTAAEAKRRAAAEAARREAEAERQRQQAEADKLRQEAEEKATAGEARSVADELARLQAQERADAAARQVEAIRPEPIRSHLGRVGVTGRVEFTISDLRKLLGWMLKQSALRSAIETAVRDTIMPRYFRGLGVKSVEAGAARDIPGIEVRIEQIANVRR